ncbi:hypothetical protein D3C80_1224090 [compost metagenome]
MRIVGGSFESTAQQPQLPALLTGRRAPCTRQFIEQLQLLVTQARNRCRQLALPTGEQQLALTVHDHQARAHQYQLIAEQLHQVVRFAQARRIEVQVAAQAFQGVAFAKQLQLSLLELRFAFIATDHRGGVPGDQFDQAVDLGKVPLGNGFGPCTQQAHHSHAGHRQQRLGHPGDGQHQGVFLFGDRQHGDDHRRKATQHTGLGIGVAQQRATSSTQTQPQRQGQQKRQWRLGVHGSDQHRDSRTDNCANHLAKTALQRHSGHRHTDDKHCHQRPFGLIQIENERKVKRQ